MTRYRFRIVSHLSRESADELDLRVGSVAIAVIKSTTAVVETPPPDSARVGRPG